MLDQMRDAGIENVLALRGDPPRGETEWTADRGRPAYATELIELIRERYDFCLGARLLPRDAPPRAPTARRTCATCKEKVDAGRATS